MRYFGNIAKLIREARLGHPQKYSQTELSSKLGYKNGQFISNIERGLCSVPVKSLNTLAEVLNLSPEAIKEALLKDLGTTLDNYLKLRRGDRKVEERSVRSFENTVP